MSQAGLYSLRVDRKAAGQGTRRRLCSLLQPLTSRRDTSTHSSLPINSCNKKNAPKRDSNPLSYLVRRTEKVKTSIFFLWFCMVDIVLGWGENSYSRCDKAQELLGHGVSDQVFRLRVCRFLGDESYRKAINLKCCLKRWCMKEKFLYQLWLICGHMSDAAKTEFGRQVFLVTHTT